jgi:hypothetical protein
VADGDDDQQRQENKDQVQRVILVAGGLADLVADGRCQQAHQLAIVPD